MERIKDLLNLFGNVIAKSQVYLNHALKEQQLSSAESNILLFLYHYGDGVNQDAIVAGIEVSKPAISRTIKSLESKGYLSRKADRSDKRARIVYLTERAREVAPYVEAVYTEFMTIAARDLPQAKVDELIQLMRMVCDNIESGM